MAVNLIDNEEIHVNQDGSDITLEIQADALKNEDVVVGSIRSKNMLNYTETVNGAIPVNSTSETLDYNTSSLTSSWIPCKPNTTYILSGSTNRSRWQTKASNGTITYITTQASTLTTPNDAKYFRVYYYYKDNGSILPTDITDIQIEEGDIATAYSPYQNLNLEIKSKYVSGTPDSNGFLPTGLDVNNIIIGVAGISPNAGFFTPFIEKNVNRLTIECKTWDKHAITTNVSFTVYYIEI